MLLSNSVERHLTKWIMVITVTLLMGYQTLLKAEEKAREATLEEKLADNVVFLKVVNVEEDDTLNIRESTSSKSREMGKIPHNKTCVAYLNEIKDVGSQKWVKISYNSAQGWVNSKYIDRNWEGPCGTYYQIKNVPRGDVLNMRESPKFWSRKVAKIPYDYEDCLTGIDKKGKRVLLDYEGTKGWAHSDYLELIDVDDCDV